MTVEEVAKPLAVASTVMWVMPLRRDTGFSNAPWMTRTRFPDTRNTASFGEIVPSTSILGTITVEPSAGAVNETWTWPGADADGGVDPDPQPAGMHAAQMTTASHVLERRMPQGEVKEGGLPHSAGWNWTLV
jgi:hypothetical protein